jgi:tRNA(fMet)-specific endonuclease VapC
VARRLILDTGVLIKSERASLNLGSVINADDDVVIAAITVAELHAGIVLADTRYRTQRSEFVARMLDLIPVQQYDLSVAEVHGQLLAHCRRTGTRRGAHDLIIAATASVTRRIVVTTDHSARFGDLPGVECFVLQ